MPNPETVNCLLAAELTRTQTGVHEHVVLGWAMFGGPFTSQTPRETVTCGLGLDLGPRLRNLKSQVQLGLAADTEFRLRVRPTETVQLNLGLELSGQGVVVPQAPSGFEIGASTAVGVLPQTGSAIFTKWQQRHLKETRLHRHWDNRENAGQDQDLTRHAWDLAINIPYDELATHWNFLKNHFGNGIPFYFYDLENNGFVYDATGVSTSGRYLVRFDTETVPQSYAKGERFSVEYSVIEVI